MDRYDDKKDGQRDLDRRSDPPPADKGDFNNFFFLIYNFVTKLSIYYFFSLNTLRMFSHK